MKRPNEWLPVAGWGLAVFGAFVVFVSGGCGLIHRMISGPPKPLVAVEPAPDTRPQPSP